MQLTDDDIARIASWIPFREGFNRDVSTISKQICPIIDRLAANERFVTHVTDNGGLSNYFAFRVRDAAIAKGPRTCEQQDVPCIVVQLSLFVPLGVYGFSFVSFTDRTFSCGSFEPDDVCDPTSLVDPVAATVIAAVQEESPYRLVGKEVTDLPLPSGIEIYEYCLCAEPWDRVFHALFSNTD